MYLYLHITAVPHVPVPEPYLYLYYTAGLQIASLTKVLAWGPANDMLSLQMTPNKGYISKWIY